MNDGNRYANSNLAFRMFNFRHKPLIAIGMIASLFVAQFSHVPHVHAGSSAEQRIEHDSRAHVHIAQSAKGKHDHSHNHGHSHNHSNQNASKCKSKSKSLSIASDLNHDNDAIYLSLSPASLSIRTALQIDQIQKVDCHLHGYPITAILNQTFDARDLWHPPDKSRHCPIYLLNMSIRC